MDPRLLPSLGWGIGLAVTISLAVVAVVAVRRRLGPGAEADATPSSVPPDWVALLTALHGAGPAPRTWIGWAPLLVARAGGCPGALRAPLVAALGQAMGRSRDPLVAASMSQVRAALAALPAG